MKRQRLIIGSFIAVGLLILIVIWVKGYQKSNGSKEEIDQSLLEVNEVDEIILPQEEKPYEIEFLIVRSIFSGKLRVRNSPSWENDDNIIGNIITYDCNRMQGGVMGTNIIENGYRKIISREGNEGWCFDNFFRKPTNNEMVIFLQDKYPCGIFVRTEPRYDSEFVRGIDTHQVWTPGLIHNGNIDGAWAEILDLDGNVYGFVPAGFYGLDNSENEEFIKYDQTFQAKIIFSSAKKHDSPSLLGDLYCSSDKGDLIEIDGEQGNFFRIKSYYCEWILKGLVKIL